MTPATYMTYKLINVKDSYNENFDPVAVNTSSSTNAAKNTATSRRN
eukprot:CAMPEP_0197858526 /NCGR_PEP_ID=MMETSP1438-20131217/32380_1 /TAXON_ID=1461541 /ORGANISM="Pterosperma sp., Strain CCMP1384" /LENGTH=45 /DNA_ID= /DNA_START= /DNA_END= /DNA_ORIENTATION=